jgi:methionyl-tRNA formyltransferase
VTRAVVFAYSEVGLRCVGELLSQGVDIPLLFTHADDPGENQWFGDVRAFAVERGIRVVTPEDPNTAEWLAEGRNAAADFLFSFYYRYMLKPAWLEVPRRGALNMHGSLLPKYRGRAPVHWAILRGETSTGASLHYMLEKPDAGALVDQEAIPILENETALEVSLKLAEAAQVVLQRSLPSLIQGTASARPLDLNQGSYFGRRRPEDGRIDWQAGARAVHDLVRAVAPPFPGAFTEVKGCRLAVLATRVDDRPAQFPAQAPCLYSADGDWFVDCTDGRRLKILQLEVAGRLVTPDTAPPLLTRQPIALN